MLGVLGLPLGVGQGNNPTCQSARAISMWAYLDPDYLLQMIAWAARDDEVVMHFEGQRLSSRDLEGKAPMDVDAVSALLVPHLDRIYHAMGDCAPVAATIRTAGSTRNSTAGGSAAASCSPSTSPPANWRTTRLSSANFHASYHPCYNGNQTLAHPQPAGLAITDSAGRFIGWHAITILRVSLDRKGDMRVYFYNPNNDSGQDFGNGVRVVDRGTRRAFRRIVAAGSRIRLAALHLPFRPAGASASR